MPYKQHPDANQRHLPAHLAAAVERAKLDCGLTYRQLAAQVGVTHQQLVRIAGGTRVPSTGVAVRLIRVLDIDHRTADELLDHAYHPGWKPNRTPDHGHAPEPMDTKPGRDQPNVTKLYRD